MAERWSVRFSRTAEKQYEKLKKNGSRPSISDIIDLLTLELEYEGPEKFNWSNYGLLSGNTYHCHLKKGHPTYVPFWTVLDYKFKQIEVYYVGTHENAPY